ncbi:MULTISPECIES: ATP-binding cassette domain-containing protein [Sellimonas]|uniref:ABC transporter ATP-binding protein n=1 Tax=Sellimonas caecigallum TaxID=2592333 RepID=A0ABS7L788_9FIRM|nr:ABC transporter ATP-binding protein [Sellimonas caecigallum]MBY0758645.1 ABC transporter ATP-binding protein [Sellimonas caecigallum]OUP03258.1 ABC transporter ATP-binding protein [Drancourtella sp. An210]OUP66375.1 ABC transporter ATP-binding protein [Drancourtella sp. An177]
MELRLEKIQKSFGAKTVLKDCTFTFEKGKIYGLLGRNGAGKTTLFNCLSDEIQPDFGEAFLSTGEDEKRTLFPDDVGYVLSVPILPDFLTGEEFVRFFMDINQDKISKDLTMEECFDIVQIAPEDRKRLIKGYSHGMKNKIQMICFMIAKPPVILLDEPLTSFDVVVALEMKQLLRSMKKDHVIIFSTHILQLATDLCDEIVVLSEGHLSLLDHEMLKSKDFEEQIIELLKDEESHG